MILLHFGFIEVSVGFISNFLHSLNIFLTSGSTLCCPVPHSGPLWQWTIRFDSSSERRQKPWGNSCVQVRQKKFSSAWLRWHRNEMFINFEIYLSLDNVYKEMHMFVVVIALYYFSHWIFVLISICYKTLTSTSTVIPFLLSFSDWNPRFQNSK